MGGGNTQKPLIPVAYRVRELQPFKDTEFGVEILNTGQIYWASSIAEATKLAQADGHKLGH